MKRPKFLTEEEAATLTRAEIVDRLYAQSEWWKAHPPKTVADRELYAVHVRIMYASIDLGKGMDAVKDYLEGRPNDYWESKPGAPQATEDRTCE